MNSKIGKPNGKRLSRAVVRVIAAVIMISLLFVSFSGTHMIHATSTPRVGGAYYNYGEALQKAILFYKAQRLGQLPANYILSWRANAALTDGADVGLDLTGGWADAGDGVKFGLPMAYSAAQLGWAVYEYRSAFDQAGQLDTILDEIKWATDYFIKANPNLNLLYYDCGDGDSDHSVWIPDEFLQYLTDRESFAVNPSTPGSDVAGETAAALAIASIIFEPTDPTYAATCLTHAEQLFTFADTYQGIYPLTEYYQSSCYLDDLTWAAVWLYLKTNDTTYLTKAESYIPAASMGGNYTQCWDDVRYGAALKLAQITKDPTYAAAVEANLDYWMPGGGITYTPGGLAWLSDWGSLRYATTAAFLAFVWSDDTTVGTASKKQAYHNFAESQINFALGDNLRGGSYEVGFGQNSPQHPHHRTAQGSWVSQPGVPAFNRHILFGGLVGGPGSDESWTDDVNDYTHNECADDYNAGFVGALAKMYSLYGGTPLTNWPQPSDFRAPQDNLTEYFVRGWIVYEGYGHLNLLFQVDNRSSWPPTMRTNLSCRYFMDLTEVFAAGNTVNDITLTLGSNDGCTLSGLQQWSGNIYYFTVDFTGTQIYPAGYTLCEKNANVTINYPTSWSDANDWSYQGLTGNPDYDATAFTGLTPYIPIYDSGVLLWGQEPPVSGVTPTPTAISATSTPTMIPTATPTPDLTATPTVTPTVTPTPTHTATPVVTATPTVTPTPTHTATPVVTTTPTPVHTATPVVTATPTPTRTATPVVTVTPTVGPATPTPGTGTIKVQFYNSNTSATTNTIYTDFQLVNTGSSAITLSNVTMRYYYTCDTSASETFTCDYATAGTSNITGTIVTMSPTYSTADTYLQVGFTSAAGSLAAGAGTTVQGRIYKSDWSNFTQTNDYSFNSTATTYVDWTYVTGYVSGVLQWGTEP